MEFKKAYKVGGASAIAARVYGTQTIPKSWCKLVWNIFVATAKTCFGEVNIDMIAGPSNWNICWWNSKTKLFSNDLFLKQNMMKWQVQLWLLLVKILQNETETYEVENYLKTLSREKSQKENQLKKEVLLLWHLQWKSMLELMNEIAPEHLEVMTKKSFWVITFYKHAGLFS